MGAWGVGIFDNDSACDWKYGLEESDNLSLVEETFARVEEDGDEYLDGDLGSEALAACEVVARLKGNWGERNAYTESLDVWIEAHPMAPPASLVQRGLAVIDRVISEPSELLEVWFEEGDKEAWLRAVADLRARVQS